MNGLEFPIDDFNMTGTWFNPRTHDMVTVRDVYFQDNQPIVMSSDGRQIPYSVFSEYVQAPLDSNGKPVIPNTSTPPTAQASNPAPNRSILTEGLTDNISNDLLDDPLFQVSTTPQQPQQEQPTAAVKEPSSPNRSIIDKALKHCSIPSAKVSFTWQNFPKKQLSALTDVMEVSVDEIVEYLYGEVMSTIHDDIATLFKDYVKAKIEGK